ncbi:hypothetical protein F5Y12DRAFT_412824 [Xylaria sp. FL1777]|nr:hypothetical protein F5Y12DRAFT_412824 [Xylaria sp. FL1777]
MVIFGQRFGLEGPIAKQRPLVSQPAPSRARTSLSALLIYKGYRFLSNALSQLILNATAMAVPYAYQPFGVREAQIRLMDLLPSSGDIRCCRRNISLKISECYGAPYYCSSSPTPNYTILVDDKAFLALVGRNLHTAPNYVNRPHSDLLRLESGKAARLAAGRTSVRPHSRHHRELTGRRRFQLPLWFSRLYKSLP